MGSLKAGSSIEHHYNWFWLILTGDTLGKLLPESLFSNALYQFFFFAMIYIGQKFLLSLILGATFDTFKSMTERQLKKEKIKELQGLVKAFAAIDMNKQGQIDVDMWDALMCEMQFSPEESALYYELMSGGADKISVFQFLGLKDVLDYRFTFGEDARSVDQFARLLSKMLPSGCEIVLSQKTVAFCKKMLRELTDSVLDRILLTFCCVDIALLLSGGHTMRICNIWFVPHVSVYTVISIALGPSIVPCLLGELRHVRALTLNFESLEYIFEASGYHVIYTMVLSKAAHEIFSGLYASLVHQKETYISTHTIHASVLISLVHLIHAFVQLIQRDGNIKDLILQTVKTKDYTLMGIYFCVFIDVIAPLLGISAINDLIFSDGSIVFLRTISCLRVFGYEDTKVLLRTIAKESSSIKIALPNYFWSTLDNIYSNFKNIVDPPVRNVGAETTGKDEKAGKKKKKKTKAIVAMDLPLRLRLGLVAADAILLVTDLHNTSIMPLFPFSIITFCRVVSILYIIDTLIEVRANDGMLISAIPFGEISISNVWILGKYYMIFASMLEISGLSYLPVIDNLTGSSLLCCVRLVRCLRVVALNKELETFLKAISGATPLFLQQMMFAFVSVYTFAMLGNLLFGSFSEHFETPLAATLTCQRLFLPTDFIDVAEDTVSKTSIFSILFFVIYFFVSLVVCNIALSIVIEWYADCLNEDAKSASAKTEIAQEKLLEGVVNRAHTRNTLCMMKTTFNGKFAKLASKRTKLHLDGIKIQKKASNDHRHQLVGGDVKLNLQDLMECKKYYHKDVDLVKDFKDFTHAQETKDDANFITYFVNADVGEKQNIKDGVTLIETGQDAIVGYILISGKVKVLCPNGHWYSIGPLNFLGHEILQPDAHYHFTYKAEDSVEVLKLCQHEVMKEMDDELAGKLVKLMFKTKENIQGIIDFERKNKSYRRRSLGLMTRQQIKEMEESEPVKDLMQKSRILVADDNSNVKKIASDVFARLGCKVVGSSGGEENIKRHPERTQYSAAIEGLKRIHANDDHFEVLEGKLILRKPLDNVPASLSSENDFPAQIEGKKILIVDDVGVCRNSLSKIVRTLGFETVVAENGKLGIEILENDGVENYAAVISDVRMPVLDGFETAKCIREKLKSNILVMFVTGDSDEDVYKTMKEYNIPHCLKKPVEVGQITTLFLQCGLINPISP